MRYTDRISDKINLEGERIGFHYPAVIVRVLGPLGEEFFWRVAVDGVTDV